jgi:hypothetical protein
MRAVTYLRVLDPHQAEKDRSSPLSAVYRETRRYKSFYCCR